MPPAPGSAPRVRFAAAVALALSAAGCAKDLSLPPLSTAPVLTGVSPAAAYMGQLVRISGRGLDPEPGANVVSFAAATARGLRFDGPALVVRVPDDAGSGPVIVSNGRGTSAPFGAFEFRGEGEPRRRALAAAFPVLHTPTAVHGVGGDVFVSSAVYEGLLSSSDGAFSTPRADLSASADWRGAGNGALFTAELAATTAALSRVAVADGARTGPIRVPFRPSALVALRTVDLVVAIGSSGSVIAGWDLDTLDPVLAATEVPGVTEFFEAAADLGDGRAVAAVYDDVAGGITLAVVDLRAARGGGPIPPAVRVPGTIDVPLSIRVAAAVADRAGPGVSAGEHLAAATLDGGDLAVARLDTAPVFLGTIETFSPSAVAGLAGAATRGVVIATKPADGLSVGADLVTRQVLWSVPGNAPGVASASGDLALVAHGGDDDVSIVNLASGSKVARVSFDVEPTRGNAGSYAGGAGFLPRDPADAGSQDLLFLVSGRYPGLLRFGLGDQTASCLLRAPGLGPLAASEAEPALWVARSGSPTGPADPATLALLRDRGAASPISVPLPGLAATTHLAPQGSRIAAAARTQQAPGVVGGGGALALAGPDGVRGTVDTGAIGLAGLGFAPGGQLWAVPYVGARQIAELWDPGNLATGGSATATHGFPAGTASTAAWLEDGLWLLGHGLSAHEALLLGPDLSIARTVALAGDAPAGAIVSPNDRLLVERLMDGAGTGTILRFYRADPETAFPLIGTLVVDGLVEALTFDVTGERLWLVTRAPDRILLVD